MLVSYTTLLIPIPRWPKASKLGHYFLDEEADGNCTAYCGPLVSSLKELRKVMFPDGKWWMGHDRPLYARMLSVLLKAKETLGGSN